MIVSCLNETSFTKDAYRFALKGRPFTIYVSIGKRPEQDTKFDAIECKNVVGEVYNFVGFIEGDEKKIGGCENCRKQAKKQAESTGQVVLTNALITRWKQLLHHENDHDGTDHDVLKSMKPSDVIPFLKRNLSWQITEVSISSSMSRYPQSRPSLIKSQLDGRFIKPSDMPSLKVAVIGGKADHYKDATKISRYHDYKVLYDITAGQRGGACPEDNLFPDELTYRA